MQSMKMQELEALGKKCSVNEEDAENEGVENIVKKLTKPVEPALYICPTPIGNLADITLRVLDTLKQVDIIAAEDTRHTRKLLSHYDIHTPMISYHKHNSASSNEKVIGYLDKGNSVALVSDAGTPIISDPGQSLISECVSRGYRVVSLPGATAGITALVGSGLCAERFMFVGFVDRNKSKRKQALERLKSIDCTLIFYEAPHRLIKTLEAMLNVFGDRNVVLAREITKRYEEYVRGRLSEVLAGYEERAVKGEFVLLVEGNSSEENSGNIHMTGADLVNEDGISLMELSLSEHLCYFIKNGMRKKEASLKVAEARGLDKKQVYKLSVDLEC